MPEPRGVAERINWFLGNAPGRPGMCAQHTWHALGGDRGNPPRWYAADANAVYDKVKATGRYGTGNPPRGAVVLWPYGANGHAAIALGDGRIATTDPTGLPGGTGVEPIDYPKRWGAGRERIWTDTYSGVTFAVEDTLMSWDVHARRMIKPDKAVAVPGGRWVTLATIHLPAGGAYSCSLQVRMPKRKVTGEAHLGRVGWGTARKGQIDETAHNPIPASSDLERWRTPIQSHNIVGGGPLAYRIWLPEHPTGGTWPIRFVAKAIRTR